MTVTPKKLFQSQLGSGTTALYTTPSGKRTQITEIWIANPEVEPINLTMKTHGDTAGNTIIPSVEIVKVMTIDGAKIVLDTSESIYAEGEYLIVTGYGIEEDI